MDIFTCFSELVYLLMKSAIKISEVPYNSSFWCSVKSPSFTDNIISNLMEKK